MDAYSACTDKNLLRLHSDSDNTPASTVSQRIALYNMITL